MGRKHPLYLLVREPELDRGNVVGFASLPVLPVLLKDLCGVETLECHYFTYHAKYNTKVSAHNLLVTNTNLDPHFVGIHDHHFAVHLVIDNHTASNLVGPQ